jgi:Zn-dependent peptidase ImmA (M78 family)
MASKDTNTGAKRARETRSELGLSAEEPLECLLTLVEQQLGLPVVIAALPQPIAGCCWHDGARIVLWVNGTHAAVRQRFTLAHELGHLRCGHDARVAVDTFETLAGKTTDSREIQANAFAAELLAPADGVRAMIAGEPTLDDVVLMAARFGLSTIAALYRLNTLGLTARYEKLKQEIDEGMHTAVWDRLAPEPLADKIAAIDGTLPRLSPALAGSALAAMIAGTASVEDAAGAAGCDPERLAGGADAMGA